MRSLKIKTRKGIPPNVHGKLEKYLKKKEFDPKIVEEHNVAVSYIC